MEKQEIKKLRELPIEGVAERLGLRVTRHKCLCPFHEDHHASLSFHVSRNTYRCFVCGATGDTISLVMRQLSLNFIDACRWLANDSNIILTEYKAPPVSDVTTFDPKRYERFFERPWLSDAARAFLFAERMIDERVVRWCRLTSWQDRKGVNWLQIPYYDCEGRLIGIQNRNLGLSPVSNPSCASGSLPREGGGEGSSVPFPARQPLHHLQPAHPAPSSPRRRSLHHRGLLRLLGYALVGSQGDSHSVGHVDEGRGRDRHHPTSDASHPIAHVSRQRRAW